MLLDRLFFGLQLKDAIAAPAQLRKFNVLLDRTSSGSASPSGAAPPAAAAGAAIGIPPIIPPIGISGMLSVSCTRVTLSFSAQSCAVLTNCYTHLKKCGQVRYF